MLTRRNININYNQTAYIGLYSAPSVSIKNYQKRIMEETLVNFNVKDFLQQAYIALNLK